jgi:N-acyl-D-amino-acid deacylase
MVEGTCVAPQRGKVHQPLRRGRVAPGYFADLAVFDPGTIADHATYDRPHRYASGVAHVIVNGVPEVRDGRFSGRVAGRALRRGNA